MVKAKDLLDKSPKEFEENPLGKTNPKDIDEGERVAEAYENISKKLEAIRNGEEIPEDKEDEKESRSMPSSRAQAEGKQENTPNSDRSELPREEDEDLEKDPLDKDEGLDDEEIEKENEEEEETMEKKGKDDKFVAEPVKEAKDDDDHGKKAAAEDEDKEAPKETFRKKLEDEEEVEEEEKKTQPLKKEEEAETLDDLVEEEKPEPPQPSETFISESDITPVAAKSQSSGIFSKYGTGSNFYSEANEPRLNRSDYSEANEPQHPARDSDLFASKYHAPPRRRSTKLHLFILILIGLAVIGGTVYLLKSQFGSAPAPTPTPAAIETPTPVPTPTPVERSQFKVRVLNGTTKSGLAKSVSEKLKGLGYQEDRVSNAPKQDFERTQVKVKSSAALLSEQLIKDLSPDYDASAAGELKDTDSADAEVILGAK